MAHDPDAIGEATLALLAYLIVHLNASKALQISEVRAFFEGMPDEPGNPLLAPMAKRLAGFLAQMERDGVARLTVSRALQEFRSGSGARSSDGDDA